MEKLPKNYDELFPDIFYIENKTKKSLKLFKFKNILN